MNPQDYAANIARRFPDLSGLSSQDFRAALAARENERARHVWGRFGFTTGYTTEPADVVARRREGWIAALSRYDHPVAASTLAEAWGCRPDTARDRADSMARAGRIRRYEGKPMRWGVLP